MFLELYLLFSINMSNGDRFICFLFGKINEQKISGSEDAGYSDEQTVF